jgi:hypothetical protein
MTTSLAIVRLTRPVLTGSGECIVPPLLGVVLRGRLTLVLSIVVTCGYERSSWNLRGCRTWTDYVLESAGDVVRCP